MDLMEITRNLLFEKLEQYMIYRNLIRQYLIKYEYECKKIIQCIKTKEFDDAQDDFDRLFSLQRDLSRTFYKYEFKLFDNLYEFMYAMDRDDIYSRRYWYEKFKEGLNWPVEMSPA